jgi:hypothetical protein
MFRLPTTFMVFFLAGCAPAAVTTAASPAASASPAATAASPTPMPTPSVASSPAGAAPGRVLEASSRSNGEDAPMGKAARTDAEWKALYQAVNPDKTPPAVDFTKEMVVAVYAGSRADAGYAVAVTDVGYGADKVVVTYKVSRGDGPAGQVISYPYVFVAINRSDLPVTFQDASK